MVHLGQWTVNGVKQHGLFAIVSDSKEGADGQKTDNASVDQVDPDIAVSIDEILQAQSVWRKVLGTEDHREGCQAIFCTSDACCIHVKRKKFTECMRIERG